MSRFVSPTFLSLLLAAAACAADQPDPADAVGGKADAIGAFCGGVANLACPDGFDCVLDSEAPDAGGECIPADPTGSFCGGFAGLGCPAGFACELEGDFPDAG